MGPQGSSLRRRWPPRLGSERWEQRLGCCPRVSPRWIGPEESRMWRTAYRQGLRSTRDVIERSGGGGRSVACGGHLLPMGGHPLADGLARGAASAGAPTAETAASAGDEDVADLAFGDERWNCARVGAGSEPLNPPMVMTGWPVAMMIDADDMEPKVATRYVALPLLASR